MATAKKWVDGRVEVARRMKDDLPSHASLGGAEGFPIKDMRLQHLKEQTRELLAKAQDRQGLKDFDAARAAEPTVAEPTAEAHPATAAPAAAASAPAASAAAASEASAPAAESASASAAAVPALANATSLASLENVTSPTSLASIENATTPSAHGVGGGSHVQVGTTTTLRLPLALPLTPHPSA